jgi:hypothetical protein
MMMIILLMYLLYNYDCYLECSSFRMHLYSYIINMAKMIKVKYQKYGSTSSRCFR